MNYGKIYDHFVEIFKEKPFIFRSPGRVNLIGEHTDYNEGFVLPAAIDKEIIFAIAPSGDKNCRLVSIDMEDSYEFNISSFVKSGKAWANYLLGMIEQLKNAGYKLNGFNCVFGGDIPIGAGLSSSAALEAGLGFALKTMFGLSVEPMEIVKLAQKAENEFVGVKCGIMDQYINIFGKKGKALKIDCRSLEYEYFPFEAEDLRIVLCDSRVSHSLASSEYNIRRKQCETGVKLIQKTNPSVLSLRDVSLDLLKSFKEDIDPVVYKRCEYVIEENARLLAATGALLKNNIAEFGNLMNESHEGLRSKYEVSCSELDSLVEYARQDENTIGCRMMGGGFGGCTINLVKSDAVESFSQTMTEKYKWKTSRDLRIYVAKIVDGTSQINL